MQKFKIKSLNNKLHLMYKQLLMLFTLSIILISPCLNAANDLIFKDSFEYSFFNLQTQSPINGSKLRENVKPKIGIEYEFSQLNKVKIYLDGKDITSSAEIGSTSIFYTPNSILNEGLHNVKVEVGSNVEEWQFTTSSPPLLIKKLPSYIVIPESILPKIGSHFSDKASGINPNTIKLYLNGNDITTQAVITPESIEYQLPEPKTAGRYKVKLIVSDNFGNISNEDWSFMIPSGRPDVTYQLPEYENTIGDTITFSASFSDSNSDIVQELTSLLIDDVDVSESAQINYVNARSGTVTYEITQPVEEGFHSAILFVSNESGGSSSKSMYFSVRKAAVYTVEIISPKQDATVYESETIIRVLIGSNRSAAKEIKIAGLSGILDTDEQNRIIYYQKIKLLDGQNIIPVTVEFDNGHIESKEVIVSYIAPPKITILSPNDWQILGASTSQSGNSSNLTGNVERPITITGTINRSVERVEINQQIADLNADGTFFEFIDFFLHEGTNLLSVTATDIEGAVSTSHITVYVDQTAPILTIEGHDTPVITSSNTIDVRGIVNDAVEGGVNAPEPTIVIINQANGQQVQGNVLNRNFLAKNIPLVVGTNKLLITATDIVNNSRIREIYVSRIAVGTNRITGFSGNYQTEPILSELSKPFVISAFDKAGLPLVDLPIRFDIMRGTGSISLAQGQVQLSDGVNPARNLIVNTDTSGIARVWLTLGSEARLAGNVVKAYNENIAESVTFNATGIVGTASFISIAGSAGTQYAQTSSPTLETLSVVVLDIEKNPISQATVKFEVVQGDAEFTENSAPNANIFDNGKTIKVTTDKNGLATIRPQIGSIAGIVYIWARIELEDGNTVGGTQFQIIALKPSDEPTQFAGIVLDHTGVALEGVRLSISRTPLTSISDAEGKFIFSGEIPLGKIDLFIDGRDVQITRGGIDFEYPELHFEAVVIKGHNNQLPHPIYLPPINLSQAQVVGGNQDVTLTIPGFEGFEMLVAANSVTFPDGSTTGQLVVSPVHNDRLPMIPPGGAAAFSGVGWTVQPSGTRFDPPIKVKIPNVQGLKPGKTIPVVQWDHDLATFVSMGNGTVSEDATQIVTDMGSGISKAGWGGGVVVVPQDCAISHDTPSALVHTIKLREVLWKTNNFSFYIYNPVEPHRLNKNVEYVMLTNISASNCNSLVNYEWDFGDDTRWGVGEEVSHIYEEADEMGLTSFADCIYSTCNNPTLSTTFDKTENIKVRDEDWKEYERHMDECDWTFGCRRDYRLNELWGDIEDTLKLTEIDWVRDAQDWVNAKIGQVVSSNPDLNEMEIFSFAMLHALNEAAFPDLLSVFPLTKIKALKIAKNTGQHDEELFKLTKVIDDILNDDTLSLVRWKKLELIATRDILQNLRGTKHYFPTRGRYNGFDGTVIFRDSTGKLRANIIEAKAWSVNKVVVTDLSAFGLKRAPNTINLNKNKLIEELRADPPSGLQVGELDELVEDITNNKFDITITGLDGIDKPTQFAEEAIRSALRDISGVEGTVSFKHSVVPK